MAIDKMLIRKMPSVKIVTFVLSECHENIALNLVGGLLVVFVICVCFL